VKQGLIANQNEAFAGKSLEHAFAAGDQASSADFCIPVPERLVAKFGGCLIDALHGNSPPEPNSIFNRKNNRCGAVWTRIGNYSSVGKRWELACD
jgi:hypothetical protein